MLCLRLLQWGDTCCLLRIAGSNEIITDGKNGYVFSEVEPIKISEAIINAYKIGIGDFSDSVCSDEEVFDKYIDLCRQAI